MASPLEIMLSSNRDQRQKELLAQGLRGRKDVGTLAMLSGDPTTMNFGGAMSGDVERRVEQRLREKENKARRDLQQGYYDQLGSQFDEMMEFRYADLESRKEIASLKNTMARIKAPTDTAMKEAARVTGAYDNLRTITGSFKDEYAKGAGTGSMIPYEGDLANWWGKRAWAGEATREQAEWWSNYQNLYELPQRNEMFGSALTETEKQAWKDANIDPNMGAETIRNRLATLQTIAQKAMTRMARNHAAVYDPDWVMNAYGPYFQDEMGGGGATETVDMGGGESGNAGVVDWNDTPSY